MKILHLSTYDLFGGASRAAYRLHRALAAAGHESVMRVQTAEEPEAGIVAPEGRAAAFLARLRPPLDRLPLLLYPGCRSFFSPAFLPSSFSIGEIEALRPDIVHLHWVCGGMLRIEDVAKIPAPVVWSLHDMWPFTGGCHYDGGCGAFRRRCGECPALGSETPYDLSRLQVRRKEKSYRRHGEIHPVGPGEWVTKLSSESSLLGGFPHATIPNIVETDLFKPLDRKTARRIWSLPEEGGIVLFGAMFATDDPRKGSAELAEALEKLGTEKPVTLVIFGSRRPPASLPFPVRCVGRLHDDVSLALLYAAADVMVVPSRIETFGLTAAEALACGTPVVGFRAGGVGEIVDHGKNGYLAEPYDTSDLARGIRWVLEHPDPASLARDAREKALRSFSPASVVPQWEALYRNVLRRKGKR